MNIICPKCKTKSAAPDNAAGRNVKCPKCGTVLAIPASTGNVSIRPVSPTAKTASVSPIAEAAPAVLACPHCKRQVGENERLAGQFVMCPHCRGSFQMPGLLAPIPIPIAEPAPPTKQTKPAAKNRESVESKIEDNPRPRHRARSRKTVPWLALVLGIPIGLCVVCCGVCAIFSIYLHDQEKQLDEVDKLYAEGKHDEAVAKYIDIYPRARSRKGTTVKRIVEHHVKSGKAPEAKIWIERALTDRLEVAYDSQAAMDLLASVQHENEERQAKARHEKEKRQAEEKERDEIKRNKVEAWVMAQNIVKANLKSPSTASFGGFTGGQTSDTCVRFVGNNTYQVTGWVDAQNGFGATVRTDFSMTFKCNAGKCDLTELPVMVQR